MFLHVNTYIFYVLYTLHTIIIFNINNTVIWLLASVSWFVLHDSGDKGKQIKRQSRIRICLHQLPDICKSKYERKRKIADISTTKGGMVGAGRFTNKRSYTGIRLGISRVCVSSCVHRLRLFMVQYVPLFIFMLPCTFLIRGSTSGKLQAASIYRSLSVIFISSTYVSSIKYVNNDFICFTMLL